MGAVLITEYILWAVILRETSPHKVGSEPILLVNICKQAQKRLEFISEFSVLQSLDGCQFS